MALRDQPYLPLYVDDYLTDEKLNLCSPTTQGVYIKIMCVFHKSESYGGILLKQKDKQDKNSCLNFAHKLAKLLPFQLDIIVESLTELLDEKVLLIDDDLLYQKRMVKDNDISIKRSESGKKGGCNSLGKDKILLKQNDKQNPEDEDVYVNEDLIEFKDKEGMGEKGKTDPRIPRIKSKDERESDFREATLKHLGTYPEKMLEDFVRYWTESNPNGAKLKFELQKTFDISRRLITWSGKEFNQVAEKKTTVKKAGVFTSHETYKGL